MSSALFALAPFALLRELPSPTMGLGGWLFMGLAWLSVTTLLVWSFVRVMSGPADGSDADAS
jgi:hypothetical protein